MSLLIVKIISQYSLFQLQSKEDLIKFQKCENNNHIFKKKPSPSDLELIEDK